MQYSMVINPMTIPLTVKLQRATELHRAGYLLQAAAAYEEVLAIQPAHGEAVNLLAAIAVQMGNLPRALELFERAIKIDPNNSVAYCNSGLALKGMGKLAEALARIDQAIALQPDFAEAHLNHGLILTELKRWDDALTSYQRVIAIVPDYVEAHLACGHVLKELNQLDAALACCDRAIAFVPDYEEAHSGRGTVLHEQAKLSAALSSFDRAVAIKPDYATAYHGRAHTLLLLGNLEKGWLDYEWRFKDSVNPNDAAMRNLPQPLWLADASLAGKTILLYGEQGLGDVLQFCRYVKCVADLGAQVVLEVREPLMSVLSGLEGVSRLVKRGDALPDVDFKCPLMSLPLAFDTRLDSVPSPGRYLTGSPSKSAKWQAKLGPKTRLRVGLVWSGSRTHKNDHNRSIPLADLLPHLPAGLEFVSLQKDVREDDLRTLQSAPNILSFADDLQDFSDTAALCDCLDLVVTVDTSVAHLSGALGKKTWVLLPFVPDWRWLMDREDTPWYSSAKLYRQPTPGDWRSVIQRVRADLVQLSDCGQIALVD